MKHSKGNWIAGDLKNGDWAIYNSPKLEKRIGFLIPSDELSESEKKANAILIQNAPKLLEACYQARGILKGTLIGPSKNQVIKLLDEVLKDII